MKTRNALLGIVTIVALTAPAYGWDESSFDDPNEIWPWPLCRDPLLLTEEASATLSTASATTAGADVWGSTDDFTTYVYREMSDAGTHDFGEVEVGASEKKVVLFVTNIGDEVLALDAALTGDECFAIESRGSGSVNSMQIAEVELLFTPPNTGGFSSVLEINGEAAMTLSARGVSSTQVSAQATVAEIGAAVKALEEVLAGGTLGVDEALGLMDQLTDLAGKIALNVVIDAEIATTTAGADADVMAEAWLFWEAGKLLQLAGEYPQAVAMYDYALACAESAASDPTDPLAGNVSAWPVVVGVQTGETTTLEGEGRKGPCATNVIPF